MYSVGTITDFKGAKASKPTPFDINLCPGDGNEKKGQNSLLILFIIKMRIFCTEVEEC